MACPRSMTQKNGHINVHEKKRRREKEEKKIQPCTHVIQTKEREIHRRSISFPSSTFHMCTILINLFDLSSPWIHCLILQYMWHKCMLPFLLTRDPHKLSLEVGWKQAMLWWGYKHNEWHERSYGEVKLWLIFAKIFSKPQSYSRKVEETEVNTVPLFNFPNIMVDTSKFTGKGEA